MRGSVQRLLGSALVLACLAGLVFSPAVRAAKSAEAAPPLLDRELFFGDPEISGAQISPDGRFISFIKPLDKTRNIWVKGTDEPFDKARPLTADTTRPIPAYFWSRDSKLILYVQDHLGDENYNIYAVDPAAKPAEGKQVPEARNLTDLKGVRAMIYDVPRTMPDVIHVGLNDRDAAWHDLYSLKLSTGERTLLRENTERIAGWFFDLAGKLRLGLRIADDGSTEVLAVGEEGFKTLYTCSVFETCGPVRYHKDGRRVYMVTNKGDGVDLVRLVLFDPESNKEELVESDPLKRVDFDKPIFSEVTDELLGTSYEDERLRIYWRDKSYKADHEQLQKKLPDKDILLGSSTADEQRWLIAATSDREPGERYLFDRKTKKLTFQYKVFDKLPREQLAPMEAVRYPSSDGLAIPAFLTLPLGHGSAKLPAIVLPHGGPWARDGWGYDPFAQFLANRGYAVLQPNFRGSTGYGKKFLNAGNFEWGLKMQDDLTWGAKYLATRGIDPKRIGILGGSYGGYATLAGVAFTPDVYAAGVSIVGPSNLITLLDSIPPYWEAIRTIFHHRMGDPTTAEGKALLEKASPLNSAAKIKTPLLVVQGANDPRVKKAESDQIVVALRERKFPVEYLVAPDEGHGFARPVNNMAMFAAAEKFLAKHLGARYQTEMTPEVATRLGEITVDPASVKLAEKVDVASVGTPKPVSGLVPGTYRYDAKIEVAGQTINMSIAREVKEEPDRWIVTDKMQGPMGEVEDRCAFEKGSLSLLNRKIAQGPVNVEIDVHDNKASGKMSMNGQEKPIDVALGGALFGGDGAGGQESLGALPLAPGFSLVFRTLDLMAQKEKLMKLVVGAPEQVTVPAGTFDAWRLDIAPAGGDPGKASVWIARDTRKVVKTTAVMPEMNGATLTAELVP